MTTATIAIVDDDGAFLEQMRALLSAAGYLIDTFRSLESAYAALCADPPSAVVVGSRFSNGHHGVDLVTDLKLREATRALPVILTFSDARWLQAYEERRRGGNMPAIWMLSKPIDDAMMLQILAQALGQASQFEREAS